MDHYGHFPSDTNGYGNALLLISNEVNNGWALLTGPGYDGRVFAEAARTGRRIPDSACGRVYIQGLSENDNPQIAIFFDKTPSPGGDHCHGLARIFAAPAREALKIDGSIDLVWETNWKAYSRTQIDLLVRTGMARTQAEAYYTETQKAAE